MLFGYTPWLDHQLAQSAVDPRTSSRTLLYSRLDPASNPWLSDIERYHAGHKDPASNPFLNEADRLAGLKARAAQRAGTDAARHKQMAAFASAGRPFDFNEGVRVDSNAGTRSRKVYQHAALEELKRRDPQAYNAMWLEIARAYREGRVLR